ncbi:hypothetical protein CQA53_02165 [Helicobacter didelphidarum]|uniref:Uncharacterized protein n=1 Tax=Helicobacter didelphidarum TaxID=2040648 RepID=A0A3D8IPQ9_9HELI|nr:hypothetical protein [Helicobacter didelphidarum]RDU67083.1 hypothetical protein CQA53_02165 [Helicobacter didelphidarum]
MGDLKTQHILPDKRDSLEINKGIKNNSAMQMQSVLKESCKEEHILSDKATTTQSNTISVHQMQQQLQIQPLNYNMFSKTQSLLENLATFSVFDRDILQKGMKFDSMQDDNSLFFKLYVGAELHLAVAYTFIFDERLFSKGEMPKIHILKCLDFQELQQDHVKICVPSANAFDYRVRSHGVDTRLFYEHPLHICPICISCLYKILSEKYRKKVSQNQLEEQDIMNLVLKNKLKNLIF